MEVAISALDNLEIAPMHNFKINSHVFTLVTRIVAQALISAQGIK